MHSGDGSALRDQIGSLYSDHHGWLQGWLRNRLGCSEQANDLSHDIFIKLMLQRQTTQLRAPRAYLTRLARNTLVDLYRRRSIEQAYLEMLMLQPEASEISPEAKHSIIETLIEIDSLLDNLGERSREIFLLAQLDGLSYVEISRRLHISVNTVRKYFIRAMSQCLMLIED
ncbi:RNA polymerase sigma factor [Nitrincola sp. A-D6]|uniref:sigma-70 family RNA polymerase sigma factor n=1 Tax=Nitrincola sp. A-D6 TaxID=1545442 RepID=UPI00051F9FAF|nr:sigma-70 family RNA polymerase sigma factor [Nitrincola sp. A-D6]KGK40894.1 RNA polymerase sigma factor [Nitrincola sp. A-D6]KGK41821.1 RNA polymerase sigma factor [Nitrincola sp. A-D6]